ncbi:MAG TPA: hypothetical protein PKD67_09960 [Ignavibacteriaceae bacterium]|nr:hypothetical protein [Ignavibacteriaceae bacterium]
MRSKIPVDDLRDLIILQFGSQVNLAKKIGLDDARVSRGIKNQSPKFLAMLKKAGIKLETLESNLKRDTNAGLHEKMTRLQERIIVLEDMLRQKDNVIENQNNLIEKFSGLLDKQTTKK